MASAHGTESSEVPDLEQQPITHCGKSLPSSNVSHGLPGHAEEPSFSPFHYREGEGKPSVIQAYCQRAIDQGGTECIWLCIRRGKRTIAKDVQLDNGDLQPHLSGLRKQCGWWNRHSLFSAIGCKEVQIRFLDYNEKRNEVEVVLMNFDYNNKRGEFDKLLWNMLNDDIQRGQCGVNVTGENSPECDEHRCANRVMDQSGDQYCMFQNKGALENHRNEIMWLSPMLDYFWRHGIGSKGIEFFRETGFITSYRELKEDRYNDAVNPYGKTVNAFMIVEGWRIDYLLWFIAISLVVSIGVVCGVAVVSHSLDDGLTAGTYALGFFTILLAAMTLLSAIL